MYNNGLFWVRIAENTSYGDIKAMLVKIRYSNDDQIAILLNKDSSEEDLLKYNKMQEWRDWASILAKAFMDKINE